MTVKTHYKALSILNFLGILVSSYLLYIHFEPALTDFCNFSDKWDCEIVNKSIYSEILGIPVALLGLGAYFSFFIFSIRGLLKKQNQLVPWYFLVLSLGLAFTLYLTAVESFVLRTYCLFCVTQQIIILIEWVVALSLYKLNKKMA